MFHRVLPFAAIVALTVVLVVPAAGDDESAADKFARLHDQWQTLATRFGDLIDEFQSAPEEQRAKLRKEYSELSEQAQKLQPQLSAAAQAAYSEAPNEDKVVTQILLEMADAELQGDDFAAAGKLTDLLLKHGCQAPGLYKVAGVAAYCAHDFDKAEKYLKLADEEGSLDRNGQSYLAHIDETKTEWDKEQAIRKKEAEADDLPRVRLTTTQGDIVLELFENEAPQAVANFIHLVEDKFYDGLTFHRVLRNFMAQGGCPKGDGTGGPGYTIYCECHQDNYRHHFTGSLSMAHAGRDTGGSQFFLTFRPTPHLDGRHTVFGRVIDGMDVLAKLQKVDPNAGGPEPDKILKAEVIRKRDHAYKPTKVK